MWSISNFAYSLASISHSMRTWLSIAYSDTTVIISTNPRYLTYIFLFGRLKGLKPNSMGNHKWRYTISSQENSLTFVETANDVQSDNPTPGGLGIAFEIFLVMYSTLVSAVVFGRFIWVAEGENKRKQNKKGSLLVAWQKRNAFPLFGTIDIRVGAFLPCGSFTKN